MIPTSTITALARQSATDLRSIRQVLAAEAAQHRLRSGDPRLALLSEAIDRLDQVVDLGPTVYDREGNGTHTVGSRFNPKTKENQNV